MLLEGNPMLSALLKMGLRISAPDGSYMEGDSELGILCVGNKDGVIEVYSLTDEGYRRARSDFNKA